jgi:succinoglycan biosynthesis protein ExoA
VARPAHASKDPNEFRRTVAAAEAGQQEALPTVDSRLATVAIPARDEEPFIGACLRSVLSQTYRDLQVVVVDGGSRDGTQDVVRGIASTDPRVELLERRNATIPRALNEALAVSRGRWFVRVDAHSTVPPDYVELAVERLQTGRWGGVGGRKDGVGVTPMGRAIAMAMASRVGVGGSAYHYAQTPGPTDHVPFGAYPTELIRELGGWDERLVANEDFEFDQRVRRAGHELFLDPRMHVAWHCRQTIPDLYRQYHRYGKAKPAVAVLHPGSIRLRHVGAALLPGYWTVVGLVALVRPRLAVAMLAPYAVALGSAGLRAALRARDPAAALRVPVAVVAMHGGWGIGFWEGTLDVLLRGHLGGGRYCPADRYVRRVAG